MRSELKKSAKNIFMHDNMFIIFGAMAAAVALLSYTAFGQIIMPFLSVVNFVIALVLSMYAVNTVINNRKGMTFEIPQAWKYIKAYLLIACFYLPAILLITFGMFLVTSCGIVSILHGYGSLTMTELLISFVGMITVVAGFIFMFYVGITYSMAGYAAFDTDVHGNATDCLRNAKEMIKGHRKDYLMLMLSFILWLILVSITKGIASVYVIPYMTLTYVNFYKALKEKTIAE